MGKTFFINYSEFTKFLVMENLKNVHGISWKSHGIRSGWQSGNPVLGINLSFCASLQVCLNKWPFLRKITRIKMQSDVWIAKLDLLILFEILFKILFEITNKIKNLFVFVIRRYLETYSYFCIYYSIHLIYSFYFYSNKTYPYSEEHWNFSKCNNL